MEHKSGIFIAPQVQELTDAEAAQVSGGTNAEGVIVGVNCPNCGPHEATLTFYRNPNGHIVPTRKCTGCGRVFE